LIPIPMEWAPMFVDGPNETHTPLLQNKLHAEQNIRAPGDRWRKQTLQPIPPRWGGGV